MNHAQTLIRELALLPHPEGGYYREMYRSADQLPRTALPGAYPGDRAVVTSIYFMLGNDNRSRYHRLASDELWFFHSGNPVTIFLLTATGSLEQLTLGPFPLLQQALIPKNTWFAAQPHPEAADHTLVSCVVAPGFSFDDFELAERSVLQNQFPHHAAHIADFT